MSSYQVTCSCGATVTGTRRPRHQVVSCPDCRQPVFVLPESPWQEETTAAKSISSVASGGGLLCRHRWSIIGGGLLLVSGVVCLYWSPWRQSSEGDQGVRAKSADLAKVLSKGQRLLSEGQFRLAQQQLEITPSQLAQLTPEMRQAWRQTLRQAALLADLSPEPLEEILRHAARVPHEEWLAEFTRRYQDKAILFDAEFHRLPGAGWTTNYQLGDDPDRPRLVFDNLQALGRLPSGESQHLVLGVRLAAIRLEQPGPQWVIRFQPDSGVFLTDRGAVSLLVPALGGSEGVELLRRQAKWVETAAMP